MVDKDSALPLYVQIQNALLEGIRSGVYRPGSQVPSELEIAEQYSVSRMTARKALENLTSKGILFRRLGKGTFVTENVLSYGLSTMLSFSQTLRARGHKVDTQVLAQEIVPGPPEVTRSLTIPSESQVVMIRRLRFVDGECAAIHTSYLEYPRFARILDFDLVEESLLRAIEEISGMSVAYSVDTVQAVPASAEHASLLGVERNSPMLQVEGVAFTDGGQPIRCTRAVYPGHMFRFVMRNTADQAASLKLSY
jgi:GntR family transcriptional regulator